MARDDQRRTLSAASLPASGDQPVQRYMDAAAAGAHHCPTQRPQSAVKYTLVRIMVVCIAVFGTPVSLLGGVGSAAGFG